MPGGDGPPAVVRAAHRRPARRGAPGDPARRRRLRRLARPSPDRDVRLTAEAFRVAPRDLARRLSLRQTVELVRIATDVFEERLPPLAADEDERRLLVEGVLRFGRSARSPPPPPTPPRPRTAGPGTPGWRRWSSTRSCAARSTAAGRDNGRRCRGTTCSSPAPPHWAGTRPYPCAWSSAGPDPRRPAEQLAELRRQGPRPAGRCWPRCRASGLVVLVPSPADPRGPGRRPPAGSRPSGPAPSSSAPRRRADRRPRQRARGARRAAGRAGRPDAPRPVAADDLLPERALGGDPAAHRRLVDYVVAPLAAAGGELLRTLAVYVEGGGASRPAPARSTSTRTPCGTGCGGSARSPAIPPPIRVMPSSCRPRWWSPACRIGQKPPNDGG